MATQGPTVIIHVPASAAVVAPDAGAASSGIAAAAAGAGRQEGLTAGDLLAAATAQFVAGGGGGDKVKNLLAQSQDLALVKKKISKDLKNARKRQTRLKTKARELSVGDLMDVLVLRAAKASERAPNAAVAAEVPVEAAANSVVVEGVFDLYVHKIYICAMYQTCFVCRRTLTGAVEAEEPSDDE
jgi:outer membrane lipoprotein SlyB